jgi:EAL domain-containing protein (putative c-di-GMP-specific phosphodiesterase class I)
MNVHSLYLQAPVLSLDISLTGDDLIDAALKTMRDHFDMPVAYLSRFDGKDAVFRNVSCENPDDFMRPREQLPLSALYSPLILDGTLPSLIPDTGRFPHCRDLAITREMPIGSHVSLPILLEDGTPYGMFCCLSPSPNPTLNSRDLSVMSSFVTLVTRQVRMEERERLLEMQSRTWIDDLLFNSTFKPVFQPIVQLSDGAVVGMEALSRFGPDGTMGVQEIFEKVQEAGLGPELELVTMAKALDDYEEIRPPVFLTLNASPELICDPRFFELLPTKGLDRIVLEVTEHAQAPDEDALHGRIGALVSAGVKIAIDDVGAGYSGLLRIAKLKPDLLKIDRSLVFGIATAGEQQAIVSSLVHLARGMRCMILGEGVETQADAAMLKALGVDLAQGWLYGRPLRLGDFDFTGRRAVG